MVELIVNGEEIELPKNGSGITYTMQIADIFNIASVASSYTNGFTLPKTPKNVRSFEQLGLFGDTSTIPYSKIEARLNNNGFSVIPSGWLDIRNTNDNYNVNIINGMRDFFKQIENKTLGKDLDLSLFDHDKTIATVAASYTNPRYRYLIADYNGKNFGKTSADIEGINIDYLVPSFNVKALWDLIFETFGYSYDINDIQFINDLWITYPKPPQEDLNPELIAEFTKNGFVSSLFAEWQGYRYPYQYEFWDDSDVTEGELINNWQYLVPETRAYRIDLAVEAYAKYAETFQNDLDVSAVLAIVVNGNIVQGLQTDPFMEKTLEYNISLIEGDVVQVRLIALQTVLNRQLKSIHLNTMSVNINTNDLGDVSLTNAFQDFAIKDFVKEIIWRTGLTPVLNNETNFIRFVPLSERLNFNNAIDWTGKYIRRKDETYKIDAYAQKNSFLLKHNNEDDKTGDGYLYVNNMNLADEKAIVSSKIYAPEPTGVIFKSITDAVEIRTDKYRIWNSEAKVDADGLIEVEYKGLSNRFYFLREETSTAEGVDAFRLVSEFLDTATTINTIGYATNEETLFDELVFKNYKEYEGVLFNFRKHDIELAITERDVIELDMTVPYYFGQEGQYYILNKLVYQDGRVSTGEFIRINKI